MKTAIPKTPRTIASLESTLSNASKIMTKPPAPNIAVRIGLRAGRKSYTFSGLRCPVYALNLAFSTSSELPLPLRTVILVWAECEKTP